MIIHLIGPGGAGKSTTAPVLAKHLGLKCIDLDAEYLKTSQIDLDVEKKGYAYYVHKNIELYLHLTQNLNSAVLATSSGFMTYDPRLHTNIEHIHERILVNPYTVLLLPAFELEACVETIVERQLTKSHESKSKKVQADQIRSRFPIYRGLGNIRVATNVPVEKVVKQIVSGIEQVQP